MIPLVHPTGGAKPKQNKTKQNNSKTRPLNLRRGESQPPGAPEKNTRSRGRHALVPSIYCTLNYVTRLRHLKNICIVGTWRMSSSWAKILAVSWAREDMSAQMKASETPRDARTPAARCACSGDGAAAGGVSENCSKRHK